MTYSSQLRIGVDVGGTKISAVVMDRHSRILFRHRCATPVGDYPATLDAITELVGALERDAQRSVLPVGIGTPGAISPTSGLLKNANSTCLNGRPLKQDLETALDRPIRIANDADCLAVSEATDGTAAGAACVFAVILGTGVGGGIAINARPLAGPNAIAGEWGHNPLPWPDAKTELPGPECWCGRSGCIETWLSGPGLSAYYQSTGGAALDAAAIAAQADAGEARGRDCLAVYESRLARALATVINLLDPEVIVLGGGLSGINRLYENVPRLWGDYVFSDRVDTRLMRVRHGADSGVRGAAWLWPD